MPSAAELDAFLASQYGEAQQQGGPRAEDLDQFIQDEVGISAEQVAALNQLSAPKVAGAAAATGTAGLVGTRLFQMAFPGSGNDSAAARRALMEIETAMQSEGMDFRAELSKYLDYVKKNKSDVSFAEYLAGTKEGFANSATRQLLDRALARGGDRQKIVEDLNERGTTRAAKASKPFYNAAFANKTAVNDQRIYDLFEQHSGAVERALKNAHRYYRNDKELGPALEELVRWKPWERDWWKALPAGQGVTGLNLEQLDKVKQMLGKAGERMDDAQRLGRPIESPFPYWQARDELKALLEEIGGQPYKDAVAAHARAVKEKGMGEEAAHLYRAYAPGEKLGEGLAARLRQAALLGPKSAGASAAMEWLASPGQPIQAEISRLAFEPGGTSLGAAKVPEPMTPSFVQRRFPMIAKQRPFVRGRAFMLPAALGALGAATFGRKPSPLQSLDEEQMERMLAMP